MAKDKDLWHDVINRKIIIDVATLPMEIQNIIAELEKYHAAKDWFNYDLKFDELEIRAKSYIFTNNISASLYDKLLAKYGGLYD